MKYVIVLIAMLFPVLAVASDDTSHLCVAYQSGPDASNPDHWTTSKIFVGDINNCDAYYLDKSLLAGKELDNGHVISAGEYADIWCDTSDDPQRVCM